MPFAWPLKSSLPVLITPLCLIALLSGCVSASKYDALEADHNALISERDALVNNNAQLKSRIEEMEAQKTKLDAELEQTMKTLEKKKAELQSTSKELSQTSNKLNETTQVLAQTQGTLDKRTQLLKQTSENLESRNQELTMTAEQLRERTEQLRKTQEYVDKTNKLYDDLVGNLTKELQDNQIKVKEMKDGINVELAQDILFPVGSAVLNDAGKTVITKVSDKLKDVPHQIIVAGFTDNVPIRGSLTAKYPTNWELAAARAASVVRLLESNGINPEKLTALSYGENSPVAANDTPEGRAQNRRIEIRLRPVQ